MTLHDAKELKENYPTETKGFTIFQIDQIWSEYSDSLAATWIIPHKDDVRRVFDSMRLE